MTLSDLNREAVLKAIEEFDALGRGDFLRKYLFRPARSYFLILGGRRYDSKAIVGAAHGYLPGCAALAAADFSGGERTVKVQLERLGFVVTSARAVDEHLGRSVRDTLLNLPKSTIEEALAEHDRLGPGAFLAALGYRPAERWILEVDGRSYPPRAVLAAAYHVHTGKKLSPNEGPRGLTDEELQRAFGVHGFAVVDRETTRVLPLRPQCWALCVDPSVYRIEDALREQAELFWTTIRAPIADLIQLALSGLQGNSQPLRTTAATFYSLVSEAQSHVLVTGYVAVNAKKLLEPLAKFLDGNLSRSATLVLDFQ